MYILHCLILERMSVLAVHGAFIDTDIGQACSRQYSSTRYILNQDFMPVF